MSDYNIYPHCFSKEQKTERCHWQCSTYSVEGNLEEKQTSFFIIEQTISFAQIAKPRKIYGCYLKWHKWHSIIM